MKQLWYTIDNSVVYSPFVPRIEPAMDINGSFVPQVPELVLKDWLYLKVLYTVQLNTHGWPGSANLSSQGSGCRAVKLWRRMFVGDPSPLVGSQPKPKYVQGVLQGRHALQLN